MGSAGRLANLAQVFGTDMTETDLKAETARQLATMLQPLQDRDALGTVTAAKEIDQ